MKACEHVFTVINIKETLKYISVLLNTACIAVQYNTCSFIFKKKRVVSDVDYKIINKNIEPIKQHLGFS